MALISRSALLCALLSLALASVAAAGPPGTWTKVTNLTSQGVNTDEVSLARTGDGALNILWTEDDAVLDTRLSTDLGSVAGTTTVFTYEGSAGDVALLTVPDGSVRAFFTGLIASDQNHDGGMSTATSPDGVTWTVQPTLASQSDGSGNEASPVYAATGVGGTLFNNGTPLSVWGDSAPGAAGYHVGTSQNTPDVRIAPTQVTVASPEAATDAASGAVAIGWNDLDTGSTTVALVQQTINPWFPLGAPVAAPGGPAADALTPVGMTGRSNGAGGIYVAYLRGTNEFDSSPAIWRVGADNAALLSNADARYPGVTMGPDGRLWAFWAEVEGSLEIHARRSNTDASSWGADTVVEPPNGTSTIWSLKGEGGAVSCGALDVVALASVGSDLANYHQRVLPGLTLKKKLLNGRRGKKAKVRFTTLDAGAPVNATVKFGSKSAATGDDGKVKLAIKRKRRTRKVAATARDDCYAAAKVKVRVRKRPAAL